MKSSPVPKDKNQPERKVTVGKIKTPSNRSRKKLSKSKSNANLLRLKRRKGRFRTAGTAKKEGAETVAQSKKNQEVLRILTMKKHGKPKFNSFLSRKDMRALIRQTVLKREEWKKNEDIEEVKKK